MSTIVLRSVKGTPLTNAEVDANFSNLNTDKTQLGGTYSSGTANGVLFLNSSKVLTTGSALTFDGTNLGVGATTLGGRVTIKNPSVSGTQTILSVQNAASTGTIGSLTFNQDTDAFGLVNNTSGGALFFATNATEQMRLTSTGLGIGTSTPGAKLDVQGGRSFFASNSDAFAAYLRYNNSTLGVFLGSPSANAFQISAASGSPYLNIDSSGNVGIGTSSPTDKLQVVRSLATTGTGIVSPNGISLQNTNATAGNYTTIQNRDSAGSQNAQIQFINVTHGDPFQGAIGFTTRNSTGDFAERVRISPSGNVGIGTSSPGKKLDVSGVIRASGSFDRANSNWTNAAFTGSGSYGGGLALIDGSVGYGLWSQDSGAVFAIGQGSTSGGLTERMRIDSSGNLLVGATSTAPYRDGRINAAAASTPALCMQNTDAITYTSVVWNTASSGDNRFFVFATEAGASIALRGSIDYNRAGGLTRYNTSSDYRAKDIFGPVVDSGAVIDSVPVYMGKMKGATQERPMFIAHETPAYAHSGEKDAVDKDGNPIYQQMDASTLVPVMWAEIQSLRQRLAAAGI